MIMHFKMMEFSAVCGLVKEQLFKAALAYLLDLSLLLFATPLPQPVFLLLSLPQSKQEVAKQQSDQAHWNYPSVLVILALVLESRCPKLFLSTDINYVDLI